MYSFLFSLYNIAQRGYKLGNVVDGQTFEQSRLFVKDERVFFERVFIRFGSRELERFPQYGSNAEANRAFANEKNKELKLTSAQVAAMENGAIYGWDTPAARPENYDKDGLFCPKTE